ncbi:hypothetical protein CHS0354_000233 [Potamilus streckersoni]|uniref:Uncharacterized protein n=1 Tax=Potamilus streckersoni TaxID=2493646 RepID=A0AAE0RQS9_9BIVA|nr:hypothetical protein CHS0354_000233 [Potamilus streckersoni]
MGGHEGWKNPTKLHNKVKKEVERRKEEDGYGRKRKFRKGKIQGDRKKEKTRRPLGIGGKRNKTTGISQSKGKAVGSALGHKLMK